MSPTIIFWIQLYANTQKCFHVLPRNFDLMTRVPNLLLLLLCELSILAKRQAWGRLTPHPTIPNLATVAGSEFHIVRARLSHGASAG